MILRRSFLVTGGAGVGLLVAWAVWPRSYAVDLGAAKGETQLGAWLKIAESGQVTVAVPQAEHGQGVWTTLPQIVADELGADWRTVAVEAAPINPLYANPLAAQALFGGAALLEPVRREHHVRSALMLTGGSTSVRMFEGALREAGAAARVLLAKAAAARWGVGWETCETQDGFVVAGNRRLRFGELAAAAAGGDLPGDLPLRIGDEGRLSGQPLPRLDAPAKVDGSANFVADVRLPDMVFASICAGPAGGASRLVRADKAAAERVRGVVSVIENAHWVAAAANNWWAANQAIVALAPRFETRGALADDAAIDAALESALARGGRSVLAAGDLSVLEGPGLVTADYRVGAGVHAALETPAATAWWHADRLELWVPTQAPATARTVAARAIGVAESAVTVHPMLIGGSFGQNLEHDAVAQAAILAVSLKRPVQLAWSRREATQRDRPGAPARARMTARLASDGRVLGWRAQIAAPATGAALAERLMPGDVLRRAEGIVERADGYAVTGAVPPYKLPALAIDHHAATLPLSVGHLRGGADRYTAFFTECFLDELAHRAGTEPMSYRIGMLGGDARLVRCLTTAASLAGWDGGSAGSGQGMACHVMAGSMIAVVAEAGFGSDGRPRVDRLVAAVDCGRAINPEVVRQQIEGGMVFGLALAIGAPLGFERGVATARTLGDLRLPRLADTPEITVELLPSGADPGGVSDLGVPAVAPAIANALVAATGNRVRRLPFSAV